MASSDRALFEVPADRLGARLHAEVFGALPHSTGRALDDPQVAAAVRPLLAAGWRPAQLAARVGALPPTADPVAGVVTFLESLLERDSPQRLWQQEQAARQREPLTGQAVGRAHEPASDQSRTRWAAEARRSLGLPPRVHRPAAAPVRVRCAQCGADGEFFVTRDVRLCTRCVEALRTAAAQADWAPTG